MQFDIDQFGYDDKTQTLSAEASTLGLRPGCIPFYVGLSSVGTRIVLNFGPVTAVRDSEGGVQYWTYCRLMSTLTVTIFND